MSTYISPPFLPQAIVAEFVARGHFEPNLERVCGELRSAPRRDARRARLKRRLRLVAGASRRAATSSGSSSTAPTLPISRGRGEADGVAFIAGPAFFPAGSRMVRAARASRSATSPREASPRACTPDALSRLTLGRPALAAIAELLEQVAGREADPDAQEDQDEQRDPAEKKTKLTFTCLRLKSTMRIA